MTETRRIVYQGSGPLLRTLIQQLQDDGLDVTVRRDGPHVGEHREVRDMGSAINASIVASGAPAAIEAAVSTFRQKFPNRARVAIQDENSPPQTHGRHRA